MDRGFFILVWLLCASIAPMAGSPVDVDGVELFENFIQNFKIRLNDQVAVESAADSSEADQNGSRVKIRSVDEQQCVRKAVGCEWKLKIARCFQHASFIERVKSRCCDENSNLAKKCPNTMKAFRNRATNLCDEDGSLDPEWFGADTMGQRFPCVCSAIFSSCDYRLAKAKQSNDLKFKRRVSGDCCSDRLQGFCSKEKKKFDELFPQSCKNFHAGAMTDPKSAPASQDSRRDFRSKLFTD